MKTYKEFSQQKIDEGVLGALGGAALDAAGKGLGGIVGAAAKALLSKAKKEEPNKGPGKLKGPDKVS